MQDVFYRCDSINFFRKALLLLVTYTLKHYYAEDLPDMYMPQVCSDTLFFCLSRLSVQWAIYILFHVITLN